MTFKPDNLPNQQTFTSKEAPEPSFVIQKEKLEKIYEELEQQSFPQRLEVSSNATKEEVELAFRKKAKLFHSDHQPESLRSSYDKISQSLGEAKQGMIEKIKADENGKTDRHIKKLREEFDFFRRTDRPQNRTAWETYLFVKKYYRDKVTLAELHVAIRSIVLNEMQTLLKKNKVEAGKEASLWVKEGVLSEKDVEEILSTRAAA